MYIATALNMHLEDSYAGLDCIEAEVRRRIFWLLYGGERLSTEAGGRTK